MLRNYCWRKRPDGYFDAKIRDGSGKRIMMHNLIMGTKYVDHIGGSKTKNDNRKANLRVIDDEKYSFETYNNMNKPLQSNNTSGYTGIIWHNRDQIWEAHISVNKEQIYLGRFENLEDAIQVRRDAERKYFGEYSYSESQITYENNKGA